MSRTTRNVVSNMVGRAWTSILAIVLVPLYIGFMSVEAYALVAFYASLHFFLTIFDLGLTSTMTREMARQSDIDAPRQPARNLLRTLEVFYWGVGIAIGVAITAAAPAIANYWLNSEHLGVDVVARCVAIMGCIFAFQWPLSLYTGALMGLQQQVLLNAINVTAATVRGGGSLLVLTLISPTPVAFFTFQIVASVLHTSMVAFVVWRRLPDPERPRFDVTIVRSIYTFAARMTTLSALMLVIAQLDKIVLSKVLTLEAFGYYSIAATAAGALFMGAAPFGDALLPRYASLAAQGDETALRRLFHTGCQLMAVFVFPAAAVMAVFSREVLAVWIGNAQVVSNARVVLSILAVATTLNLLMAMIDLVQMAYGWLKPAMYARVVALLAGGPLLIWMAITRREIGAATAWLIIFAMYVLVTPHFLYARLLRGEKWKWYLRDVAMPLGVAFATTLLCRAVIPIPSSRAATALYLMLIGLGVTATVAAATPASSERFMQWRKSLWPATTD